jgi:hypothetical protein
LYLTTPSSAETKLQTQSYTLGELLDQGFSKAAIVETLGGRKHECHRRIWWRNDVT